MGKQKYSEESVFLCELAQHKRQKEYYRLEPESPGVSTTTIRLSGSAATIRYSAYVLPTCAHLILLCMVILTAVGNENKLRSFSFTECFDTSGLLFSRVLSLFLKISSLLSTFHHVAIIKIYLNLTPLNVLFLDLGSG